MTAPIILDDFEKIKITNEDSEHEKNIKLIQQIQRILDNRALLIKYILKADGKKIKLYDIRKDMSGDAQ